MALRGEWFDAGYRARLALIRRLDLRARLGEIRCPVSLFAADRDRVVASLSAAHELAAGLADVELTVLPAAGHLVLPLAEEPCVERLKHLGRRCAFGRGEPATA